MSKRQLGFQKDVMLPFSSVYIQTDRLAASTEGRAPGNRCYRNDVREAVET